MQIFDEEVHADTLSDLEINRQFLMAQLFGAQFKLSGPFSLPDFRGITAWEALTCVGFHPNTDQLEAVVEIRRDSGYSGDLCSDGSTEYVRFFVDWHDGTGFQDVGLTSLQVFDIAGPEPIQHVVRLALDDAARARCCNVEVIPTVRAVLGWNEVPSLDPDELPVYGNRIDAHIQIAAKFCIEAFDVSAIDGLSQVGQLNQDLLKNSANWSSLVKDYRELEVEEERLTFPALAPMLEGVSLSPNNVAAFQPDLTILDELDLNLEGIFEKMAFGDKGNTRYEELTCVGLDSALDTFGAVIHVKRPAGYSGNLCRRGSTEFVRFWADWDADGIWHDLGTAKVQVHDLATLPPEGVHYAVALPVDISDRVRDCDTPQVIRIRASLSWEREPRSPNRPETWGNLLDGWVRLRPGDDAEDGLVAELYRVGGVAPVNISPTSYFAYPSLGVLDPNSCSAPPMDRPFAGNVSVAGRIRDFTGNAQPIFYQVQYAPHSPLGPPANWLPVTHQVTWYLDVPPPQIDRYLTAHAADGWFEYQEKLNLGPNSIYVRGEHLAVWGSQGLPDGDYSIRLAFAKGHPVLTGSQIFTTDPVTIKVDNTSFRVSQVIGSNQLDVTSDLDLVVEGASTECRRYKRGEVVRGNLRALDNNFHHWSLNLQPAGRTGGATPSPRCRAYRAVGDRGDANQAWTLDTTNMQACGYTLRLRAYDRAIVHSNGALRHAGEKYIGIVVD